MVNSPKNFIVTGDPAPQPRHRATNRGGHVRMYIPKNHPVNQWKNNVKDFCNKLFDSPLEGALSVEMDFVIKRPKSLPKKQNFHIKKPDIDNLIKSTLDAMNGIVFKDDKQVVCIVAAKHYSSVGAKEGACIIRVKETTEILPSGVRRY